MNGRAQTSALTVVVCAKTPRQLPLPTLATNSLKT